MSSPQFAQKSQRSFQKLKPTTASNTRTQLSSTNTQYIFNFPQKIYIKNEYINIQNSSRDQRENLNSMNSLDHFLQNYSRSLSPNPLILTEMRQRKLKINQRNKSENNFNNTFNNTIKNSTFFEENDKSNDSIDKTNKNQENTQKGHDYLDILFDDSLICLRNRMVKEEKNSNKKPRKISLSPILIKRFEENTNSLIKPLSKSIFFF